MSRGAMGFVVCVLLPICLASAWGVDLPAAEGEQSPEQPVNAQDANRPRVMKITMTPFDKKKGIQIAPRIIVSGRPDHTWLKRDEHFGAADAVMKVLIEFVDSETYKRVGMAIEPAGFTEHVQVSPDGKTVLTIGEVSQIWNAATGLAMAQSLKLRWISLATFSPDGHVIVLADGGPSGDTIRFWDVVRDVEPEPPVNLVTPGRGSDAGRNGGRFVSGSVESFTFSPDGTTVTAKVDWYGK